MREVGGPAVSASKNPTRGDVSPAHHLSRQQRWRRRRLDALFGYARIAPCRWCGQDLVRSSATIDHVVARSAGGSNEIGNTVLACRACNEVRGHEQAREARKTQKSRSTG